MTRIPLALCLVILGAASAQLLSAPAQGAEGSFGWNDVFIHLTVGFKDADSGRIGFGMEVFGDFAGFQFEDATDRGSIADPFLSSIFENLTAEGTDDGALFGSILDGGGDPAVERWSRRTVAAADHFFIYVGYNFSFPDSGGVRGYRYLPFLGPFHLPPYDPTNWSAMRDYEAAYGQFSRVRVSFGIEAFGHMNLDISDDGSAHERGPSGESASFTWGFQHYTQTGHEFIVSDRPMFAPVPMLVFSIAATLIGTAVLAWAVWRKRFRSWAWAFPAASGALLALPLWFFYAPSLNPYGLLDGGLIAVCVLSVSVASAMHFVPNGARREAHVKVEDEPEVPEFEMPKVMYVDRTVVIKEKARPIEEQDPYYVLGLRKGAEKEEVERAYRKLVLRYHPDKFTSSPEWVREEAARKTQSVVGAYENIKRTFD